MHKSVALMLLLLSALAALRCEAATGYASPSTTLSSPANLGNTPFECWLPVNGAPRAIVLSIHGFGLHKGAYAVFARKMAAAGIATYALDVRGFGAWAKSKSAEFDSDSTLIDIGAILSSTRRTHPNVPVFLLGESMGGAMALQAAAMYPDLIDGVISSVPGNVYFKEAKTSLNIAMHMRHRKAPLQIGKQVIDQATSHEALKVLWETDPNAKLAATPDEMIRFKLFMNRSHRLARHITNTPVLVLQGADDHLAKADSSKKIFDELATADKTFVVVPNAEHLILEEGQLDQQTAKLVAGWIDKHCQATMKASRPLNDADRRI